MGIKMSVFEFRWRLGVEMGMRTDPGPFVILAWPKAEIGWKTFYNTNRRPVFDPVCLSGASAQSVVHHPFDSTAFGVVGAFDAVPQVATNSVGTCLRAMNWPKSVVG